MDNEKSKPESIESSSSDVIDSNVINTRRESGSSNKKGTSKSVKYALLGVVLFLTLMAVGAGVAMYLSDSSSDQTSEISMNNPQEKQSAMQMEEKTLSATVEEKQGEVWKIEDGRRVEILAGDTLSAGDEIETEETGRLVLKLEDGSTIRVSESSNTTIAALTESETSLVLDSGSLFAIVEEGSGGFSVAAEDVTVTTLGTSFSVENIDDVLVSVYENSVQVEKEGEAAVEVKQNFEYKRISAQIDSFGQTRIETDNFLQWSLQQEIQRINNEAVQQIVANLGEGATKEDFRAAVEESGIDKKELQREAFRSTAEGSVSSISLNVQKTSDMLVNVSWTADGLAENGFRLVWSRNPGPTFPARSGDKYTHKDVYGYEKHISLKPGSGTWYFRVCESLGDSCGTYSNEVSVSM